MRTATTARELAEATGLTEQRVREVCAALVANEVAVEDWSGVRLSPAWDALTGPSALSPDARVALVRARAAPPPVVRERLREDDRILELGCGAAGQLLCTLRAFPEVRAIGRPRRRGQTAVAAAEGCRPV
jgi:hypothetical protein